MGSEPYSDTLFEGFKILEQPYSLLLTPYFKNCINNMEPNPGGPPDLSASTFTADYLRDPKAIKSRTEMPNFNLDDAEIDAVTAFLIGRQ